MRVFFGFGLVTQGVPRGGHAHELFRSTNHFEAVTDSYFAGGHAHELFRSTNHFEAVTDSYFAHQKKKKK